MDDFSFLAVRRLQSQHDALVSNLLLGCHRMGDYSDVRSLVWQPRSASFRDRMGMLSPSGFLHTSYLVGEHVSGAVCTCDLPAFQRFANCRAEAECCNACGSGISIWFRP